MKGLKLLGALAGAIIAMAALATVLGQYIAVNQLMLHVTDLALGYTSPTQLLLLLGINATNPSSFPTPTLQGTAALFLADSQVGLGSLAPFSVGAHSSLQLKVSIRVDVVNATQALLKALASGNLGGLRLALRGELTSSVLGLWTYTRPYSANFSGA
jgi:LEA14-like dessication related protein